MSDLLGRAFAALGPGPTWRELELVADTLAESGDEDAIAALNDPEGFDALAELASASGSSGFVALDLATEFAHPSAHTALRDRRPKTLEMSHCLPRSPGTALRLVSRLRPRP